MLYCEKTGGEIMEYFNNYVSNTLAGSGNQRFFLSDENTIHRGRVFYKIFKGGKYNYSFLYSNIIDSTFANGRESHANIVCEPWDIIEMSVGICKECFMDKMVEINDIKKVTFDGKSGKHINPGEFFCTDPVEIDVEKDNYICVDMTFKGTKIPYHDESILPLFKFVDGEWKYDRAFPLPGMVGCDRKVKKKVAFFGDSITQGIGSPPNSYLHWNAVTAENIGTDYSFWNLGIGYARAEDAASGGAWFYKATKNDCVALCFGVNDIYQGRRPEQIKEDLKKSVIGLKDAGVKVLIQSIPTFDYLEIDKRNTWNDVNDFIVKELVPLCDGYFDCIPSLSVSPEEPYKSKYNPHPDETGSAVWAKNFTPVFRDFIERA